MSTALRIVNWVAALAPYIFFTIAFYHAIKAVPVGAGYVTATNAFQAIFYILVAIFILIGAQKIDAWADGRWGR